MVSKLLNKGDRSLKTKSVLSSQFVTTQLFTFSLLVWLSCTLTSCWTIKTITVTDYPQLRTDLHYEQLVGQTKQQVLTTLSAPNQIVDDGMGGEILIYESTQYVTEQNSASTIQGDVVAPEAQSDTKSHAIGREYKSYIHAFINDSNICYHVNAEVYTQATTHKECYRYPSSSSAIFACFPPAVGVWIWLPWYLINQKHPKRVDCE